MLKFTCWFPTATPGLLNYVELNHTEDLKCRGIFITIITIITRSARIRATLQCLPATHLTAPPTRQSPPTTLSPSATLTSRTRRWTPRERGARAPQEPSASASKPQSSLRPPSGWFLLSPISPSWFVFLMSCCTESTYQGGSSRNYVFFHGCRRAWSPPPL